MSRRRREADIGGLPAGIDQKALDRVLDDAVDRRLKPLQSHLSRLEHDADTQGRQMAHLQQMAGVKVEHAVDDDRGTGTNPDSTWGCKKCGRRLGYYDNAVDVVRSAKGTHVLWIHTGPGGWVKTLCPGCSEENWLHDTPDGDGQQVPSTKGEIVLDVPLLQSLLLQAEASEHGYVKIEVVEGE